MIPAEKQGDEFTEHRTLYYSDYGVKLHINIRFDGNGNSIVRFVVSAEGKETTFEKFDAAAENYNHMQRKAEKERERLYPF